MKKLPKLKPTITLPDEFAGRYGTPSASPDGYALRAEIRSCVDYSGETESYIVLLSEGKSWPYLRIPDDLPDYVLEAALAKLNA